MKATIAGITYEGTYEEITAIVDRMEIKIEGRPFKQGIWGLDESLRQLEEFEYRQRMQKQTGSAPAYLGDYIVYNGIY